MQPPLTTTDREISEQPEALERTLKGATPALEALGKEIRGRTISTVMIAARGSSDNAGVYAKYVFQAFNRVPVAMATPSLYTFHHAPPRLKDVFVLGISQSGQSQDIVEVMAEARRQGALCAAITRDDRSPLAHESQHVLKLETGPETAVAATKTFSSSLALLAGLSVAWEGSTERAAALSRLPEQAAATLEGAGKAARESAPAFRDISRCVVISRGFSYGIAMEIALKMKELTYVTAEPYSSADFQHGPMAMIEPGFPAVLVAGRGVLHDELAGFAKVLAGRKARLVAISDSPTILDLAETALPFAEGAPEWLSPVLAVLPGQLFALRLSQARGINPDVPRGLNKVTVTR
ncbi:MAG TPA: SIS domain-containing protein [Spirochaetia bacterium]|nr:SIS domain-containing protein [Spirochaetia bacterium]